MQRCRDIYRISVTLQKSLLVEKTQESGSYLCNVAKIMEANMSDVIRWLRAANGDLVRAAGPFFAMGAYYVGNFDGDGPCQRFHTEEAARAFLNGMPVEDALKLDQQLFYNV